MHRQTRCAFGCTRLKPFATALLASLGLCAAGTRAAEIATDPGNYAAPLAGIGDGTRRPPTATCASPHRCWASAVPRSTGGCASAPAEAARSGPARAELAGVAVVVGLLAVRRHARNAEQRQRRERTRRERWQGGGKLRGQPGIGFRLALGRR